MSRLSKNNKSLNSYKEFKFVDFNEKDSVRFEFDSFEDETPDHEILQSIYAPDELGHPRSDIAIMLSKDTNPVVRQYISEVLQKAHPIEVGLPSADLALELARQPKESDVAYADRLKAAINTKTESK